MWLYSKTNHCLKGFYGLKSIPLLVCLVFVFVFLTWELSHKLENVVYVILSFHKLSDKILIHVFVFV